MKFKRILSGLLAAVVAASSLAVTSITSYGADVANGSCGTSATWSLDSDGVLTVSGTGEITADDDMKGYSDQIKEVIVNDGITKIGDYTFQVYDSLMKVTLPDTLTEIGKSAFNGCHFEEITIPENVTTIARNAVASEELKNIIIKAKEITSVSSSSFRGAQTQTFHVYEGSTTETTLKNAGILTDSNTEYIVEESDVVVSGDCGPDAKFTIDSNGKMTITGTGAANTNANIPFEYKNSLIKEVEVKEGITSISNVCDTIRELTKVTLPTGLTEIGDKAFNVCVKLESISIPETVTKLGESAFQSCLMVTEFELPSALTEISKSAFRSCSSLTEIVIPENVTTIGEQAFYGCSSLNKIYFKAKEITSVPASSPRTVSAFARIASDAKYHVYKDSTTEKSLTDAGYLTADNTVYIGEEPEPEPSSDVYTWTGTWTRQKGLEDAGTATGGMTVANAGGGWQMVVKNVDISKMVQPVLVAECTQNQIQVWKGEGAVSANLITNGTDPGVEIALEDKTSTAFTLSLTNTGSITSIKIYDAAYKEPVVEQKCGENVTWTFDEKTGVLTISGQGPMYEVSEYSDASAWEYYKHKDDVKEVVINDGVTEIGNYAFGSSNRTEYPNLTKVTLPKTLTKIGKTAFKLVNADISIPESVTDIGNDAFNGTKVSSVTLKEGMNLGGGAFSNCEKLTSLTIPKGINYGYVNDGRGHWSSQQFAWCTALETVVIEGGGNDIHAGSSNAIKNVIAKGMFNGCIALNTVTIKDAETIEEDAFYNCSALKTVTINGSSLKTVESTAFKGCTKLETITIDSEILESVVKANDAYCSFDMTNKPTFKFKEGSKTETTLDEAGYLVSSADMTKLNEAIEKAEAVNSEDYTRETYEAVAKALDKAREVLGNYKSTQDDVDAAAKALEEAIAALEEMPEPPTDADPEVDPAVEPFIKVYPSTGAIANSATLLKGKADKGIAGAVKVRVTFDCASDVSYNTNASIELNAEVNGTNSYEKFMGTDTSYKNGAKGYIVSLPLKYAINSGESVDITAFTYSWTNAKDYVYGITRIEYLGADGSILRTVIANPDDLDTAALEAVIAEGSALIEEHSDDYTRDTRVKLASAILTATQILEGAKYGEVTQSEIDDAAETVRYHIDNLVKVEKPVDFTALNDAISKAEAIKPDGYTADSYATLTSAIEEAKKVAANTSATQEQVDAAAQAIDDAVAALVSIDGGLTGAVTTPGTDAAVTVTVTNSDGEVVAEATANGTEYTISGLDDGDYIVWFTAEGCAERSYAVTVTGGNAAVDAELHIYGDVNGDGKITTVDVGLANAHAKGVKSLDDYDFAVAEMSGDGMITTVDVGIINSAAKAL